MTNRPGGVWVLPAYVGTSRGAIAALQRDFAQLRTLDHPHIARLLELGCNGQQYYVTSERLDGEPLREVLTHLLPERLEVGEADDVVRAIGSALVYAHQQGVVHGDVRAENVLVTMDRRFLLTNFLARRFARGAVRQPRPADDLTGLAKLAAELYTGSPSTHALRAAAHDGVPAARLNATRAVLEASNRRPTGVAEFLTAAGLATPPAAAAARRPARLQRSQPVMAQSPSRRSWSWWRLAVPVVAMVVIATLVASYRWPESTGEFEQRGIEALRGVASRVTAPAPTPAKPSATVGSAAAAAAAPSGATVTSAPSGAAATVVAPSTVAAPSSVAIEPPAEAPPKTDAKPATPPAPAAPTEVKPAVKPVTGSTTAQRGDPAVLSLDVPKIAAREDHMVVAIDVLRSGDTTRETDVGWWTSPDTAHDEDDYAGGRRVVTFPPGSTVERVLIPIVNDNTRESDEVFTVHLSRPRNGVAGAVTATRVTLLDDD
jgi:hypothetical protein